MRTRALAVASATLALSVLAACGDDDPTEIVTPPPPAATSGDASPQASAAEPSTDSGLEPGSTPDAPPQGAETQSSSTVPSLVAGNADLATLNTAIVAAGLKGTLGQPGPYTVFAPNNDAFAKLGSRLDSLLQPAAKTELADLLKFHVVSGEISLKDLKDKQLLVTLQGTRLRVSRDGDSVSVGNSRSAATVVSSDVDASNGVVHVVDTVLTPRG